VGTFDAREGAQALAHRLQSLGYAAALSGGVGGAAYEVRVGGYLDRGTADSLVENLRKAGFDATLTP